MSFTESLTKSLQARELDIIKAVQHVSVLKRYSLRHIQNFVYKCIQVCREV